jgi:hypothetical protein
MSTRPGWYHTRVALLTFVALVAGAAMAGAAPPASGDDLARTFAEQLDAADIRAARSRR